MAAIQQQLRNMPMHAYCLHGPSGVGKTTIARIIGEELNCELIELDAGVFSSVDNTRELVQRVPYRSLLKPNKLYIIDECHALSSAAWQSLLKVIEEPPDFVYFVLCTTAFNKVPRTIQTRCAVYYLPPVKLMQLVDFLGDVCRRFEWRVEDSIIQKVAAKAEGSVRQALVLLDRVDGASEEEAGILLEEPALVEDSDVLNLCRYLANPSRVSWVRLCELLGRLRGQPPETMRMQMRHYFLAIALKSEEARAFQLLEAADALDYCGSDFVEIVIGIARILNNARASRIR